jgi:CHASE1-domain containing sensor protein
MLENKADVPVSAPQTHVIQLEATIRSAHALLQAGLVGKASTPHAAYTNHMDTDKKP